MPRVKFKPGTHKKLILRKLSNLSLEDLKEILREIYRNELKRIMRFLNL